MCSGLDLIKKMEDPEMTAVGKKVLSTVADLYKDSAAKPGACAVM